MDTSDMKLLFKLYNSEKGHAEIKDYLDEYWSGYSENDSIEVDSFKILREINAAIQDDRHHAISKSKVFFQWTTAAAAAILVAVLVSASLFFDITLKNKEVTIALNEVIAPAGHLKDFYLPDGTRVWLNPGSSLIYSGHMMEEKIRDVRLWGQAYFEVAKDQDNPFVLQMGDIGLKVTGTSFNASNYKDDPQIEIVLKTGEVRLFEGAYTDAERFTRLEPGQIAHFQKGSHGFQIEKTDILKYTSWTQGILMFRDDRMADVFKRMERWYNVKIVVEDPRINNYLYTATIKNESLEKILQLIEYTSHLECELIKSNNPESTKPTILITTKK